MLFHSLVHTTRAGRYISINEFIVGFGGMGGFLLATCMQWLQPHYGALYPVCMVLMVGLAAFQIIFILRKRAHLPHST